MIIGICIFLIFDASDSSHFLINSFPTTIKHAHMMMIVAKILNSSLPIFSFFKIPWLTLVCCTIEITASVGITWTLFFSSFSFLFSFLFILYISKPLLFKEESKAEISSKDMILELLRDES